MFQTLKNAWKTPDIKKKILFTLLIVLLYQVGASVPVPFVSSDALGEYQRMMSGNILGFMNMLSGNALANAALFALSVSPYITASIVIQLLTVAIPALERMAKDGEEGKKKISAITRIVTIVLAIITAYGYTMLLESYGVFNFTPGYEILCKIIVITCYVAGSALIMWLAEKINDHGIGNGISIILFANIVASGTAILGSLWGMITSKSYALPVGILLAIASIAITLGIVVLTVWFTNSERRIPIQYAKRVVGRKMYGGQASNLPLKMNMAGVMPIIFANSIVAIPATIATFFPNSGFWKGVNAIFGYTSPLYIVIFIILIFAFSYFYIMISFNPVEVSNNIKNNGGAVPGIRPGKPTSDYIKKILNRVTFMGAIFLGVIAGLPLIINTITSAFGINFSGIAFGGTSLLIVVGVVLETVREIEAQLSMRNYKGFLD